MSPVLGLRKLPRLSLSSLLLSGTVHQQAGNGHEEEPNPNQLWPKLFPEDESVWF